MSSNDQADEVGTDQTDQPEPLPEGASDVSEGEVSEAAEEDVAGAGAHADAPAASKASRRRILIGSQRDPAAYRSKRRDWIAVEEQESDQKPQEPAAEKPAGEPATAQQAPAAEQPLAEQAEAPSQAEAPPQAKEKRRRKRIIPDTIPERQFPLPNLRDSLPSDLEEEFARALGDAPLEEMMSSGDALTRQEVLEPESQHTGRVVAVQRDDVFVELGGREQGCISARLFETPPEPGTALEVVVQRLNPDDGLYDLTLPGAAAVVEDWSDVHEGMLVEARVTGHNSGGLECEVNHLRGFIPLSQVSLHRVEDLAQFVEQKWTCLVTECKPQRRNLVLSRRAVLEREKEEARQEFIASLEPGQIHEGVVRKLLEFGAFVDIGGIDGLLHVSQLSWARVNHPGDVLSEGQKIQVKIDKIDKASGKMSLGYREMLKNPWEDAAANYPANSVVEGTVSKLMEFGAFVELEPGVEGLVHISELSHKRVPRTSDVVSQGGKVQCLVLSVDPQAERISLSIARLTEPEPEKKRPDDEPGAPAEKPRKKRQGPTGPLLGGLDRSTGGESFGLKW